MGSAKRTNQGGSILVYIIIGAVLAAAVVGTVIFVRHRGEQARSDTPLFTSPAAAPQAQPNQGNSAPSDTGKDAKPSTTPSTSPTPAPAPAPATPNVPRAGVLPQTGPTDTAMSLVAAALLAGTTIAYVRSRCGYAFQQS